MEDMLAAEEELLGKSRYGTVYKATLDDGRILARKRLRQDMVKGQKEFEAEVAVLGKVRHPNLLALRAYHRGLLEAFVVFDYVPKGTLSALLDARATDTPMDWASRIAIAEGTARGLAYLHDDMNIIHGNLNARNVLLTEQYHPKVADFGLFRLMATGTNYIMHSAARESGYCAPELSDLTEVSTKTDVYSLGIIILELLTGKLFNYMVMDLPQWLMSEMFWLMRDKARPSGDELVATLALALKCVDPLPLLRPNAREVLWMLEKIRTGPENGAGAGPSEDLSVSVSIEQPEQIRSVLEDSTGLSEHQSPLVRPIEAEVEQKHIWSGPGNAHELEQAGHIPSTLEDSTVMSENGSPFLLSDNHDVLQQSESEHSLSADDVDGQSSSEWSQKRADLFQLKTHSMDHSSSGLPLPRDIPFHLLEEITDGFSEERKLGSGAFGKVYMGVHNDGEKIAVKMLYDMPGLDKEQFLNEFSNLARLQHPNIVRLVGYCHEIRNKCVEYNGRLVFAERIHMALCFEYMPCGSLDKHLSDEFHGLDWDTRYTLIKGICMGLKYLHEELKYPIFHLDLKPANILLDENMMPKIADFGLSRLFGEERTWITKSSLGTLGYLPPEYINRNIISNKFDIFSLGVVIMKIIIGLTGYSRIDEMPPQEFVELVQENWRNRLHAAPMHLLGSYLKQVKGCVEIALSSMEADRHKRPHIGDIIKNLNEID